MIKTLIISVSVLICRLTAIAQDDSCVTSELSRFPFGEFAFSTALVGIGAVGLENDNLKFQNFEINDEISEASLKYRSFDNFSQYVPVSAVLILNLSHLNGKHNTLDLSCSIITAFTIMSTSVVLLKSITHEQRPDGSAYNSFPSGHTATAFAGAEILRVEYGRQYPVIAFSGYSVTVLTGFMRMYNRRHWLTDVVAGAGVGILSARVAYLLLPLEKRFVNGRLSSVTFVPDFSNNTQGFCLSVAF